MNPFQHFEACDASAAAPLGTTMFIVGDDESALLRVYANDRTGPPLLAHDLTHFLKPEADHPEIDIEASAWIGDRLYWISSHAQNKDGKTRPSRHRLFATTVRFAQHGIVIAGVGTPYRGLRDALLNEPKLGALRERLVHGAGIAPKKEGGFNIEGLCATPDGTLLIAFRNPVPDDQALLVPLTNPDAVMNGVTPEFGKPILLDLDGLGVRSIDYARGIDEYLILAGPPGGGECRLYRWKGPDRSHSPRKSETSFAGLTPEGLVVYPGDPLRVQVLSDDGTRLVEGTPCKDVAPAKRSFRSLFVTV